MIYRNITDSILAALTDTPVILINGARQTGKSTLVQWISKQKYPAQYITLDNATLLSGAKASPQDFIAQLEQPVIIDEIQRAPELFLAIKEAVDANRKPGQFLLTGSANIMLLPKLSESLAGRIEIVSLLPFSQGELHENREHFIDQVFADDLQLPRQLKPIENLWDTVLRGGYPESVARANLNRRKAWFGSFITSTLQRDVRDIANIEGLTMLPRLLELLSARAATLLNISEISRAADIPHTTLKRYMTLLETTFLIKQIPAWSSNLSKRLVKSPKVIINDTGLISYLQNITPQWLQKKPEFGGRILENFVIMELVKQSTWSEQQPNLFHFRTQTGHEVDIVLENGAGMLVGIEVKASRTVGKGDFKGLSALAELVGERFLRGIVIYTGENRVAFGKNMLAIPVSQLWS